MLDNTTCNVKEHINMFLELFTVAPFILSQTIYEKKLSWLSCVFFRRATPVKMWMFWPAWIFESAPHLLKSIGLSLKIGFKLGVDLSEQTYCELILCEWLNTVMCFHQVYAAFKWALKKYHQHHFYLLSFMQYNTQMHLKVHTKYTLSHAGFSGVLYDLIPGVGNLWQACQQWHAEG